MRISFSKPSEVQAWGAHAIRTHCCIEGFCGHDNPEPIEAVFELGLVDVGGGARLESALESMFRALCSFPKPWTP